VKGCHGRILHIDATESRYWTESLGDEIYRRYLGGKGLGVYLLRREVDPQTDPLGPGNKLIFALGPLNGTRMYGMSRYGVFAKSPLTGLFAESYSGGYTSPAMKAAGYDAIILHGQSPSPIFLEISDEGVKFHPAEDVWGKETNAAEDALLEKVGVKGAQAIVIGPAGENQVAFACIQNNYYRCAGRTGMGAVLGSKKVKGLVFHGQTPTTVAHPEDLEAYMKELLELAKDNVGVKNYKRYGTVQNVGPINKLGAFPTRNHRSGTSAHWEQLSGEYLVDQMDAKPRACYRCFMACGKFSTVKKGRHKGLQIEGPEYETIYAFGGLCDIEELEEVAYLNDLCNRLGLDTMTGGNLVGLIMDGVDLGRLDYPLKYGDADGAARLLEDIAYKRSLGAVLAKGIKTAAAELGLSDLAIHVKGMEPAAYDPRYLKGMALAYATSPRGACHLRATFYRPELVGLSPRNQIDGKAEIFVEWEDRMIIQDCLIMCRFFRDLIEWDGMARLLKAVTDLELSKEDMRKTAIGILDEVRRFNLAAGMVPADDYLPERYFTEPLPPTGEVVPREDFDRMLAEYYQHRGWTPQGVPTGN
jgi:aldehyde:ferredoxin oxidoreductase